MQRSWEVLEAAGVPLGAPRPRGPADLEALRVAFARVAGFIDDVDPIQREALHAWLCAFHSDWPETFARTLGPDAAVLLSKLESATPDPGRHVKLRRIARTHLARML